MTWSVPTALILVLAAGKWPEFVGLFSKPKLLFTLFASSLAVATNWTIYIWAVTNGRVLEGSLGYFINPLIVFLFAALFFGERFRPLQFVAAQMRAAPKRRKKRPLTRPMEPICPPRASSCVSIFAHVSTEIQMGWLR